MNEAKITWCETEMIAPPNFIAAGFSILPSFTFTSNFILIYTCSLLDVICETACLMPTFKTHSHQQITFKEDRKREIPVFIDRVTEKFQPASFSCWRKKINLRSFPCVIQVAPHKFLIRSEDAIERTLLNKERWEKNIEWLGLKFG